MDRYQPQLGELIRDLRAEHGFSSQDHLADDAGVDVRTLRSLENGEKVQDAKLAAICNSLNITITYLKSQSVERKRLVEPSSTNLPSQDGPNGETSFAAIGIHLDQVDEDIQRIFGQLNAPTREDGSTEFSARRLVSSLSSLGIPPEISFNIIGKLPTVFPRFVADDEPLSTNHIRSAVAQLISELSPQEITDTEAFRFRERLSRNSQNNSSCKVALIDEVKFDWASRYARRYGNPTQILQILEENGQAKHLDYAFIKRELIPHVLRRVLGEDFAIKDGQLVNPSVISEMARSTLEEFRRLGLYTIRYRTALWLTEDLAIHPPHPWIVSEGTRATTIAYDFDRADANLQGMKETQVDSGFGVKHRFSEVTHHLCSAILATYSGFLGHKHTSSVHILRHWLAIQDHNPLLWKSCELSLIDSDLYSCGIPKQEFSILLKRVDVLLMSRRVPPTNELVEKCEKLKDIARNLYERRSRMARLNTQVENLESICFDSLSEIVSEVIFSCFGAKRVFRIVNKENDNLIGFAATPAFEGTVLAGRPPLCLFLFCEGNIDPTGDHIICEQAVDQLNAHRLAETCVILCAREPSSELRNRIAQAEANLPNSHVIKVFHIGDLQRERITFNSACEFIDFVFSS